METSRLQLNVITLTWPASPITCYFGQQPTTGNAVKLPDAIVPPQVYKALQASKKLKADDPIYTSFTVNEPGFVPVKMALHNHRSFAKCYYSNAPRLSVVCNYAKVLVRGGHKQFFGKTLPYYA